MREVNRKSALTLALLLVLALASISFLRLSFFEVRETVALADEKARKAAELWSGTQSLLLTAQYDTANAQWLQTLTAIDSLSEISLLKGIGILDPEVERARHELTKLAETLSAQGIDSDSFEGSSSGKELIELTQTLQQISRVISDYANEQSLYFQNLLLFAALLSLTGLFALVVVEQRNRSILKAEQRARHLSRHLISDYEKSMHSVALDLHDDIAQELYLLRMESESSRREELLNSTIEKIRQLSYDIRPGKAASLPLAQGLRSLLKETAEKAGWTAHFTELGLKNLRLPYEVRIHLYRSVQEALTNIRKHANAGSVTLKAVSSYPILKISVHDDGYGFNPAANQEKESSGLGLRGMRERIEIIGGRLTIHSRPGNGTEIQIELEIKEYLHEEN